MEYSGNTVDAGEPLAEDPLTTSQSQIDEDTLELLGASLIKMRDEWVKAKIQSNVEKRMLEAHDQYHGDDAATKAVASMMDSVQQGFPISNKNAKPQRSTVFINITRPKTNTAVARVANMLLPTDDRNFGLKPNPSPELTAAAHAVMEMAKAQGVAQGIAGQQSPPGMPPPMPPGTPPGMPPMQPGMPPGAPPAPPSQPPVIQSSMGQPDPASILAAADAKSKSMQTEIDSQLTDCHFNAECRSMIQNAGIYGTGILKGPVVVSRESKTWIPSEDQSHTFKLEIVKELKPASWSVSPWNVYTDPSCKNNPHTGSGIWEAEEYTSKQVRELVGQPGYVKEQIAKVLDIGPEAITSMTNRNLLEQRNREHKRGYKMWQYWGEFTPEHLRAAGCDIDDSATGLISGCVVLINDTVVKGFLNPMETGEFPYDFFNWEEDESSPWGYGVPFLVSSAQRVLNAAWRQMMDNSGNSNGPQIFIKPGVIAPVDGLWQITGNKLWNILDDAVDARTAISSINIENHSAELQAIIKMAQEFADDESMIQQIQQGERGNAPDTLGGMIIQTNTNNVVLGRIVKNFDDNIIEPHIERYVDWNMAYSDKPEIKGDHTIQARGTSALLVKDIQNQTLLQFGQFQGSGVISPMVNWENWIKAWLKAQHIDATEILKTDAEIAQLSQQPPEASPEQIRAQASLEVAQTRSSALVQSATIRAGAQVQAHDIARQGEIAYAETERSMASDNNSARLQELQLKRDLALLQYAQQHQMTIEQIKADLSKTAMVETTKRQLAAAEMQMRTNENHADRVHESLNNPVNTPIQ